MTVLSQATLLAAVMAGTLCVIHGMRWREDEQHGWYAVLCGALFLRYSCSFVDSSFDVGPGWDTASVVGGLLVPATALSFFRRFLEADDLKRQTRMAWLATAFLVVVAMLPIGRSPWLQGLDWTFAFAGLYGSGWLIWRRLRSAPSRIQATRLQYLLVGLLIAVTLTALDFLLRLGLPFLTVGNAVSGIYLYFVSAALLRHRLLDLKELLGKGLVLLLLAIALMTIYTLLVVWVGDRPGVMIFNTLVASIVILILFDPLRGLAERRVLPLLFREKFEFERRLEAVKREMAGEVEVEVMARRLMGRLERSRRVTHASLYVLNPLGSQYRRVAWVGPEPPLSVPRGRIQPLLELIQEEGVVLLEELEEEARRSLRSSALDEHAHAARVGSISEILRELRAGVVIPLRRQKLPPGLLLVHDERVREAYSYDEIARLVEVAGQAALTVENSHQYAGLRERDRLAAIGEMAAGLAHEVRNPLGAIKGAAQVLQSSADELDNPMLSVIVEEVNRLDVVVSRFLDYSRPMDVEPAPTDLNVLVERTLATLRADPEAAGVVLVAELDGDLPLVMGDDEMLKTVLVNLGRNALEAIEEGGTVTVTTGRSSRRPPGVADGSTAAEGWVEVRVVDTGAGMDPEELDHVFIPFYTNKSGGTGLGLAISQRVVRKLGGALDVVSERGRGSTFTMYLPVVSVAS